MVVACLAIADFEEGSISLKLNLDSLELLSVNLFEAEHKSVLRDLEALDVEQFPLKVALLGLDLPELNSS